jgi:hypothetical protein
MRELKMKMNKNIIMIMLSCFVLLSACSKTDQVDLQIEGIYDGYTYTSPFALFSTHLRDWADMKGVQDSKQNDGATMQLDFVDKEENAYRVMASFAKKGMDAHALLEKMVEAGKAEGKNIGLSNTADGEECLLARVLLKADDSEQGFGLMNVIFVRDGVVYDLSVKSKPMAEPEKATAAVDKAFEILWNRCIFRGQVEGLLLYPEDVDPRIPAIIAAGKRVAGKRKYGFSAETKKKGIMKIIAQGSEEIMTLIIGVSADGSEIFTTESVSCKANDVKAMSKMQEEYYQDLSQALVDELLTINRSSDFDPDLTVLPKKEK